MPQERHRPLILRLALAEGVTTAGDAVTIVALPLTAVLFLSAGPAELALIGAAQAIPIFVLSVPVGAWVDRRSRRWPILIVGDLIRAALLACVPLAAALNVLTLPMLVVIAFLVSVAGTFFDLAFAGWVPRLLGGDTLHQANARIELARSSAMMGGPALGGALVGLVSAPFALLADAASFVGSALLIGSSRRMEAPRAPGSPMQHPARELAAGARHIFRTPLLAAVQATVATNNFSRSIAMAVAVLYLVRAGQLEPAVIGLTFAVGNSGFVIGALASRRMTTQLGVGRTMQAGISLFGPSMLALALAPRGLIAPAFGFMLFAHGFGIAIHNVNQVTVRQMLTPDELRARVSAVGRLVGFGTVPLGTVLGGVIAALAGVQSALLVSAIGLLFGSLPYLLVGVRRLRTLADLPTFRATARMRDSGATDSCHDDAEPSAA